MRLQKLKGKGKGKGKGIEPEVQAINDASSKPISGAKWGTKRKRLAVDTGDFEGVDGAGAGASESVSRPRKLRKRA